MRLLEKCPTCQKTLVLIATHTFGNEKLNEYKCGHFFTETQLEVDTTALRLTSVDGKFKARKYQEEGIKFLMESGFNAILGDQMRLGKTPQVLLALANSPERFPCLQIVRAANMFQWLRENRTWVTDEMLGVFPIIGTKAPIPHGFKSYVISMDTFSREGMSDKLLKFGFKLCIVDEMHSFKNVSSKRSQALIAFLKEINIADITHTIPFTCPICRHTWEITVTVKQNSMDSEQRVYKRSECEKCMAACTSTAAAHVKVSRRCAASLLSGTSIVNRAEELFVPLNIVAPSKVSSLEGFRRSWLRQDEKGKWSRVRYLAEFKEEFKPFMLRREKEDVYTDIPEFQRIYTVIELSDDTLKKAYNSVLDNVEANLSRGNYKYWDNIGELSQLRQICAMAKVQWTADYVEASLLDNNKKIGIGVHHHKVRDALQYACSQFGVCKLDGEDSPETKDRIAHNYFQYSPERVLILGMDAMKEGVELVYLETLLILERAWSSTREEQFEYRAYNPDKDLLASRGLDRNKVTLAEYILCKGTIDEDWHDMVEQKRKIFGETIGNHWDIQSDTDSFKKLLETTVSHRLR